MLLNCNTSPLSIIFLFQTHTHIHPPEYYIISPSIPPSMKTLCNDWFQGKISQIILKNYSEHTVKRGDYKIILKRDYYIKRAYNNAFLNAILQ